MKLYLMALYSSIQKKINRYIKIFKRYLAGGSLGKIAVIMNSTVSLSSMDTPN